MRYEHLMVGAKRILECGCVKAGEKVLILTDNAQPVSIARALFEAAKEKRAEAVIITMEPVVPAGDLPTLVDKAMKAADLIITPTSTSIYHSKSTKEACAEPYLSRMIALSEITEDAMMNGGVTADFASIRPMIDRLLKVYTDGNTIRYTTPAGTDLRASIANRDGYFVSGVTDHEGMLQALPTIEVFIAPIEESVEGIIVVDASCSGGVGLIDEPIYMDVKAGKIVSIKGGTAAKKLQEKLSSMKTPNAYQIAEYGVGLNPKCRVIGTTEDEGRYGTCHFGIGDNTGFGGVSEAPIHLDVILWKPTITIDEKKIFQDGECII
jgi:2,5-dihydroxypyridine 5,6-dioxygenase